MLSGSGCSGMSHPGNGREYIAGARSATPVVDEVDAVRRHTRVDRLDLPSAKLHVNAWLVRNVGRVGPSWLAGDSQASLSTLRTSATSGGTALGTPLIALATRWLLAGGGPSDRSRRPIV